MIQDSCASIQWITEISSLKKADKVLVQKLIRALMLLEGLGKSDLEFVFKGGTALMLLFKSPKRLSIDIDIIVSGKVVNLEMLLSEIAIKSGFTRAEEKNRVPITGIQKAHYKFYFPNSLKTDDEEYILLDILFESIHYCNLISSPIQSDFILHQGAIIDISTPDFNNIMGDKLTAFAPKTTGIPYFKNGQPMGQEIIKQLYDIGNIFEQIDDVGIIKTVFSAFALVELEYRNMAGDLNIVMEDIIENCLTISLRQQVGNTNFEVLMLGLKQIRNFIFYETYHIEKAIVHAARTAYLVALMQTGTAIDRYNYRIDMTRWQIQRPHNQNLNKLKKTNPEAFYYWFKYYSLR
jgi:hypothetical protein